MIKILVTGHGREAHMMVGTVPSAGDFVDDFDGPHRVRRVVHLHMWKDDDTAAIVTVERAATTFD